MNSFVNGIREWYKRKKKSHSIKLLNTAKILYIVDDNCTLSLSLPTDDPFDNITKAFRNYTQMLWEAGKLYKVITQGKAVFMQFKDMDSLNETLNDLK